MTALIGSTGFVGSNLGTQHSFTDLFHSRNIEQMRGRVYELVVCAGVQAQKWWANLHPEEDWMKIVRLLEVLKTVSAQRFILISTVDIYATPVGVNEETPVLLENHVYGRHRHAVEEAVRGCFSCTQIVRLPGLFGCGLKKNVIYDLLAQNCLEQINPEGMYQYYSLTELWRDLEKVILGDYPLINFATEPVSTREIVEDFFPELRPRLAPAIPFVVSYDMRTLYAHDWASPVEGYLYDRTTVKGLMGKFICQSRKH